MNCRKIQDIIMTDYIDNELDETARKAIDAHVRQCAECHAVKQALMATVIVPLRGAATVPPPDMWAAIQEKEYNRRTVVADGLLSFFRPLWINIAVISMLVMMTLAAGNYVAYGIWYTISQQHTTAVRDVSETLALAEFNDMPSTEVENVYSTIVGG
jgi:predicted anti-sigma-YlaC factor YlaD